MTHVTYIGIQGKAHTGKSSVAKFLAERYDVVYCKAFADPLKTACAVLFGLPTNHFYQSEIKEMVNPVWGVSPRQILQFVGTEMFRQKIQELIPHVGERFWELRLKNTVNNDILGITNCEEDFPYVCYVEDDYRDGDIIVIEDVRFQNEVDFIQENNGIIIRLFKKGEEGDVGLKNHASENQSLVFNDDLRIMYINNNGTLEELYEKVVTGLTNFQVDLNFISPEDRI
jgi:hypothetical protein